MNSTKQNQTLWTVSEVADLMKVTERTVREWIRCKRLAAIKFGSHWRVHQKEVDRIVAGSR